MLNLIVNAGAFGLLAWMAVYWLPKVSRDYSEAVVKTGAEHAAVVDKMNARFVEMQKVYRELLIEERQTCEKRHAENLASRERQHAAVYGWFRDVVDQLSVTRGAIKGLHTTLGTALAWMQGRQGAPPPEPRELNPQQSGTKLPQKDEPGQGGGLLPPP